MHISRILKTNDDQQIIYGEVYAPGVVDSQGEMMLAEEVRKMCHAFMAGGNLGKKIDRNHDNVTIDAYPIESFIAEGHPDYNEGAWVLGVKIEDGEIWKSIKSGEYNGFSFEAYAKKTNAVVVVETLPTSVGLCEKSDDHTHFFIATINTDGKVVKGHTSVTNGHSHKIKRGTATELTNGHRHRTFV